MYSEQLGAGNTITQAIPTLQAIQGSTLLQHIQPAGLTVQGAGIQQVYLIADPAQIETLKVFDEHTIIMIKCHIETLFSGILIII